MNDFLSRRNPRDVRAAQQPVWGVVDQVRLAKAQAEATGRLTEYVMQVAVDVNDSRVEQARGLGPEMNAVLLEFQLTGYLQLKKVQRNFLNNNGF